MHLYQPEAPACSDQLRETGNENAPLRLYFEQHESAAKRRVREARMAAVTTLACSELINRRTAPTGLN